MFKIKSADQQLKTEKRIDGLEEQIRTIQEKYGREKAERFTRGLQHHLLELKKQVQSYIELREKGINLEKPQDLSEVGSYLVKVRIASHLTQAALAKKLGVSQPMVHKYESTDYQGATMAILSKVSAALKIQLLISLRGMR